MTLQLDVLTVSESNYTEQINSQYNDNDQLSQGVTHETTIILQFTSMQGRIIDQTNQTEVLSVGNNVM